jgi:hypothetical protein
VFLHGSRHDLGRAIAEFEHDPRLVDHGYKLDVGEHLALLVDHLHVGCAADKGLDAVIDGEALPLSDYERAGKTRESVVGEPEQHPGDRQRDELGIAHPGRSARTSPRGRPPTPKLPSEGRRGRRARRLVGRRCGSNARLRRPSHALPAHRGGSAEPPRRQLGINHLAATRITTGTIGTRAAFAPSPP